MEINLVNIWVIIIIRRIMLIKNNDNKFNNIDNYKIQNYDYKD